MINSVNIDLTNNSCWGTSNEAKLEENKITLYIKLVEKNDVRLEFTKPNGAIVTIEYLSVNSEQMSYEMPFELYAAKGTLKLRVIATDYITDYINFNILGDYLETDDIWVKYNATTGEFNINKCQSSSSDIDIAEIIKQTKLAAWPIGSYYWSSESTEPSVLFGGTWERVKDKFIYALGDSGKAGDTGGSSSVKLTKGQIPTLTGTTNKDGAHIHDGLTLDGVALSVNNGTDGNGLGVTYTGGKLYGYIQVKGTSSTHTHSFSITNSSQTNVNTMPPYQKAYCWKRTA